MNPEAPPYAVPPASFWSTGIENLTKQIKIIDFGEASFPHDERKKMHTPLPFRAPESFFGESIGQPADAWAFDGTAFDIFANCQLFDGFIPSADTILVEMVDAVGILPPQWWNKWGSRSYYFSNDGTPKPGSPPKIRGRRSRLHYRYRKCDLAEGINQEEPLDRSNPTR